MKRKDFLKAAWGMGLAGSATALKAPARTKSAKEEKPQDRFKEAWVLTLMENMEKTLDPAPNSQFLDISDPVEFRKQVLGLPILKGSSS